MLKQSIVSISLIGMLVLFSSCTTPAKNIEGHCSSEDFQSCKTCKALSGAISKTNPNEGEYLHAAQWNGLYTSFVHNCYSVGELLLQNGADPNWGGIFGSMILTVVNKWPHNDERINAEWANLLLKYGANARRKIPDEEKSPIQMINDGDFEPDYPNLWKRFIH